MKIKKQIENEQLYVNEILKLYDRERQKKEDKVSPTAKEYAENNYQYVMGIYDALSWVLQNRDSQEFIIPFAGEYEKIIEMRKKDGV